jgi:hypothetical protein
MKTKLLLILGAMIVTGAVGVWPSNSSKCACPQIQEETTDMDLENYLRRMARSTIPHPEPLPEGCVRYYYTGLGNDPVPAEKLAELLEKTP